MSEPKIVAELRARYDSNRTLVILEYTPEKSKPYRALYRKQKDALGVEHLREHPAIGQQLTGNELTALMEAIPAQPVTVDEPAPAETAQPPAMIPRAMSCNHEWSEAAVCVICGHRRFAGRRDPSAPLPAPQAVQATEGAGGGGETLKERLIDEFVAFGRWREDTPDSGNEIYPNRQLIWSLTDEAQTAVDDCAEIRRGIALMGSLAEWLGIPFEERTVRMVILAASGRLEEQELALKSAEQRAQAAEAANDAYHKVATQAGIERDELLGLLRRLVDSLPKCNNCNKASTRTLWPAGIPYCDEHGENASDGLRAPALRAPALRAALARLEGR